MKQNSDPQFRSKLEVFFTTAIQEIYWSEQNLVNVMETMSRVATDEKLKAAFQEHKQQTQTHVQRLDQAFELMNIEPEALPSVGLQGLFDEGWQVIDETDEGSAQRDAALIIAAQKVEHYEIACYGSLKTLASTLNKPELADLFLQTLNEEKETDAKLTEIAESGINEDAGEERQEDEAEQELTGSNGGDVTATDGLSKDEIRESLSPEPTMSHDSQSASKESSMLN